MAIIRWRHFPELTTMQREMNRLFDSFFRGEAEEDYRGSWRPEVDIKETPSEVIITAELPGINKSDVKVTLQDNMLQISGEKRQEEQQKDETYHRIERVYGSFCRTFTLPALVDSNKIQAIFKDGVLRITIPKTEQAKPREIEIKAEK